MVSRATCLAAMAAFTLTANALMAQTIYALTPMTDTPTAGLASFDAASPGTLTRLTTLITGLGGLMPVGIEVRPANGQLYLLGYNNSAANPRLGLFMLAAATGVATPVGAPLALNVGSSPFNIGFGFDPTTDQVRVVGNTASYRLDPNTGALVATDTPLAYASTDSNAGQSPNVGTIGYSNSYAGSAATVLYALDKNGSRLVTQSPPNSGTLHTVGPLGLSLNTSLSSFDVGYNATSASNTLYLVRSALVGQFSAEANLYTVHAGTGAATLVGAIGTANGFNFLSDIAVARPVVSATRACPAAVLLHLYLNPSTGSGTLAFSLLSPGQVVVNVFDTLGRLVASQPAGWLPAGPQTLRWTGPANYQGLLVVHLRVDGRLLATCPVLQLAN